MKKATAPQGAFFQQFIQAGIEVSDYDVFINSRRIKDSIITDLQFSSARFYPTGIYNFGCLPVAKVNGSGCIPCAI